MSGFAPTMTPGRRTGRAILAIASVFGVGLSDVVSRRRTRRVSWARQVAIGVLYYDRALVRPLSLPELGRMFGGRDHTTILHSLRRYRRFCRMAGLDPVPAAFLDQARALAAHLGVEPAPVDAPDLASVPPSDHPPVLTLPLELRMPPSSVLPATLAGDLFGPVDGLALASLGPDERLEAILLFGEKLRGENPRLSEAAIRAKTALVFAMSEREVEAESLRIPVPRRAAVFDTKMGEDGEPLPVETRIREAADGPARNFTAFAQTHLTADPSAGFEVGPAYDQFCRFARRRGEVPLSRANFGAALQRLGGARQGARIAGLALRAELAEAAE